MKRIRATILMIVFIAACGKIEPEAPQSLPPAGPPTPGTSIIDTQVALPIPKSIKLSAVKVPGNLGAITGQDVGQNTTVDIRVEKNGKPSVINTDGDIQIRVPVLYYLKANWYTQEGITRYLKMEKSSGLLDLLASVQLSINEDWQLQCNTDVAFSWKERPTHKIGPVDVRMGEVIGETVNRSLISLNQELVDKVRGAGHLKSKAGTLWHKLNSVIRIDESPATWMVIKPTSAHFAGFTSTDKQLFVNLRIGGEISVIVSDVKPAVEQVELPALKTEPQSRSGSWIDVPIDAKFANLDGTLNSLLDGKAFDLGSGYTATLSNLHAFGNGKQIIIKADLATGAPITAFWKKMTGWVYLAGTAVIDPESKSLGIKRLDYDPGTRNALQAKGVKRLLGNGLTSQIGQNIKLDYKQRFDEKMAQFKKALKRVDLGDQWTLSCELSEAAAGDIRVSKEKMDLYFKVKGALNLSHSTDR